MDRKPARCTPAHQMRYHVRREMVERAFTFLSTETQNTREKSCLAAGCGWELAGSRRKQLACSPPPAELLSLLIFTCLHVQYVIVPHSISVLYCDLGGSCQCSGSRPNPKWDLANLSVISFEQ
jgi:hypothetical protein